MGTLLIKTSFFFLIKSNQRRWFGLEPWLCYLVASWPQSSSLTCCHSLLQWSNVLVLPTTSYVDILTPEVMMALDDGTWGKVISTNFMNRIGSHSQRACYSFPHVRIQWKGNIYEPARWFLPDIQVPMPWSWASNFQDCGKKISLAYR